MSAVARVAPVKPKIQSGLTDKASSLGAFKKLLIGVVVLGIVGGLFYTQLYVPYTEELSELQAEVENLDKQISDNRRILAAWADLKKASDVLEASYSFYLKFLPETNEIPTLLKRISDNAAQSGLIVNSFKPQATEQLTPYFAEVSFDMEVEGPYLNVVRFLYNISMMDLIVTMNRIEMSTPKLVAGDMIIKANCRGSTYRLLTEAEAADQAKKAAAKK